MPVDYSKIRKFKDNSELEQKINAYFEDCERNGEPFTITGLALALGTSRCTLLEYEGEIEGEEKISLPIEERQKMANTIKRAKLICENYAERYLYTGKNVAGAIFNLKNNYNWKDKTEMELDAEVKEVKIEIVPATDDKLNENCRN